MLINYNLIESIAVKYCTLKTTMLHLCSLSATIYSFTC